jgi:hypothetical protein
MSFIINPYAFGGGGDGLERATVDHANVYAVIGRPSEGGYVKYSTVYAVIGRPQEDSYIRQTTVYVVVEP